MMKFVESRAGKLVFARLFEDEDLIDTITNVAAKSHISTGVFILIGTLKRASLGFFQERRYTTIDKNQPLEIVSCSGNISVRENRVFAHAHISVSDEKGRVFGGHVMPGCVVGAAGELVLMEAEGLELLRKFEEKIGLYLWSIEKPSPVKRKTRSKP